MSHIRSPNKELELFLQYGQGPTVLPSFSLIHKAFEYRADTQPYSVAAEYSGISITYAELELKSNALANSLINNGLQPRQRVCLVVQRSIHMLVGILAILKCGCQYVPLDGGVTPEHYISHLVRDTEASTILCLNAFVSKIKRCVPQDVSLVVLDRDDDLLAKSSASRPIVDVGREDGAYIIYTSGTSGPPKGVDVSHGNVTNLLCLEPGNLGIKNGTKVAQLLSISFDMGQWEILGTLLNGGTLLIRGSNWSETLKQVNTIISTPSILGTFTKNDYPNIRVVALAGEACPSSLADEWGRDCELYNCCGPTEVTIVNTTHLHVPGQRISIGRPVPNTSVYILDENENPVPIGQPGIMWAGGKCVSRGYLKLPQETATKFKLDKFRDDGSLMYNTGDRCRWLDNGTIEPLGRVDDQVKIKGFRIELASVTIAIEKISGVDKACSIYRDQVLWAFYSGNSAISEYKLKEEVGKAQPYYAVPSKWEFRAILPLTTNGKIDKNALWESVTCVQQKTVSIPPNALVKAEKQNSLYSTTEISTPSGSSINTESKHEWTLPEKNGYHGWRALRHRFFSVYRRFLSIVLIGNVIGMIVAIRLSTEGKHLQILGSACAINLTISILTRQDYVLNLLFTIFCSMPVSMPLWIRARCAKIYHIGGIHSGCGVAAAIWLLLFSGSATLSKNSVAVQVVSYLILALLMAMIASAQPKFRSRLHNKFELIHRFAGWTSLALFWIQTILLADHTRGSASLGTKLKQSPPMWLLIIATTSIIVPWLHLRKVNVRADVLSDRAVRLYFDYAHPVSGAAVRLSSHPLTEWHAFATITNPKEKGFSVLVSNAGDWTKRQIDTAPTKIWVRGIPTCGVIRISTLFKKVVLVATGSGIGPCLPVIYAKKIPARIFWSTPKPELTFGSDIINAIKDADEDAVIHDTKTMGRPDMVAITYRLLKESGAEAVVVISNQKLTQLVVYAMEARGIPAYGAIFDS